MEKSMQDMAGAVLNKLRLEGELCDVVIKVGDVKFDAHKVILCSCSPYFRALFTGPWATPNKQMYTIPGLSPEMMHIIINFAYTHSVAVTKDNVMEVLAAADQLSVTGIIQTCCVCLENQLCLENCISIWMQIDCYHLPELKPKVFDCILGHFEELALASQDLLELSVQQLAAIIENDRLNVREENIVFEAVLRWINHLPDQRRGHISELLPKVRLGLMTTIYLYKGVMDNAVVKNSTNCEPIIDDAVTAVMELRDGSSKSVNSNPLTRPRLPSTILLVTGGKDGSSAASDLEAYDARANCWVTVSTRRIRRAHHGAAVLNNFVYLIGGCSNVASLNTVEKFDLVTCTWHQVAPMNKCRCYASIVVQNGCIYAIGGFSGRFYHNSVECYKPETGRWTMVASMRSRRSGAGATALNGKVYVCGGFNGVNSLFSAECYDADVNKWTVIPSMRTRRSGLGVAAYKGRIYAVGGNVDRDIQLSTVEVYNPWTNRWNTAPSMHRPRSYFGIEVLDGQLFVVGGYASSTTMSSVERYNEEAGMWFRASDIGMPRSGLSCCVLHGLHGVVENLFPRRPLMLPNVEEAAGGSI